MKSKTEYLTFNTKTKRAFVNITPDVRKIVQDSKIREGLCLVNAMHITASVFINDNESGLHGDFDMWLEKLAPHSPIEQYRHNETGEDNADAHLKRRLWDEKL
jgi:secondary thiamine-phosphate synthase enzyme